MVACTFCGKYFFMIFYIFVSSNFSGGICSKMVSKLIPSKNLWQKRSLISWQPSLISGFTVRSFLIKSAATGGTVYGMSSRPFLILSNVLS